MMTEVKTSIDPDTVFGDGQIILGIHRPLAWFGDLLVKRRGAHREGLYLCSPEIAMCIIQDTHSEGKEQGF